MTNPQSDLSVNISERVRKILAEHLGISSEDIHDDVLLVQDLGCDSLDALELSIEIEEEFDLDVEEYELIDRLFEDRGASERKETVGDLIAIVETLAVRD